MIYFFVVNVPISVILLNVIFLFKSDIFVI